MISNQCGKRMMIVINKRPSNKLRICQLHVATLRSRRRRRNVLCPFQFPHHEIAEANQKWNKAQRPYSTFPIIDRAKKDY